MSAPPETAEVLAGKGYEIVWVSPSPKPLDTGRDEPRALRREFHPLIDALQAQVSEVSYREYLQTLEDFGTRFTYSDYCDTAAQYLYDELESMGFGVEFHHYPIAHYEKLNVIATLPGEIYPDEVVYVTAHYDCVSEDPFHFAPGADDNASGVAALLETARALRHLGFERTIKFACFSGEEQGLVGSAHYVADIHAAGEDVAACFNLDMIAWSGSDPPPGPGRECGAILHGEWSGRSSRRVGRWRAEGSFAREYPPLW